MLWIASTLAHAAGTTPDDRVEVYADAGIMTAQAGFLVGAGGGLRRGGFSLLGTGGFGARDVWFAFAHDDALAAVEDQPAWGLGSLAGAYDFDVGGGSRIGAEVIAEAALVNARERDCSFAGGCRYGWFLGDEDAAVPLGLSFQPAYGLRVTGTGVSGAVFAAFLGIQPHVRYGELLFLYTPRFDLALYGAQSAWSFHVWGGRYGLALGFGHRLSRVAQ